MALSFLIKKVLNNNVLMAEASHRDEVVLIGAGIGFGKKKGDLIATDSIEKMFVLTNPREQEQYKKILSHIDESLIGVISEALVHIEKKLGIELNEHIHISLTDHIGFALKRIREGLDIENPFLLETMHLYPSEYALAEEVVKLISAKTGILLPEGEVGFITLHIHSATSNKSLTEVNHYSQLVHTLIQIIEDGLDIRIDRSSIHHIRLIRELQYTIQRVSSGEQVKEAEKLAMLLKEEYPICYNVAWKIMKVIQYSLKQQVYESEIVYLTLHLQRFSGKFI
ncbi:glucose PTS transporter transcription antiterminator GlcT [Ammoniphilus sp. YIM 78166]|uniref:glucose PTS transporter transcription antiterminator GlcT n=1 Tax=Ammoniphilus sp. YIM 78166 TaxID=1644106 RepID=UPI00106F3D41|nr:PRD domain-containing protein [Ammoniphilus sp. YIM 78166]